MKKKNWYIFLSLCFFASCQNNTKIYPVDDLRNESILDNQNKGGSEFLYFVIEDFKNMPPELVAEKILAYLQINELEKKILKKRGEIYCYFYQKKTFKNYKKILGDQNQISDSGSLHNESKNLIALVIYRSDNLHVERNVVIYKPASDTAQILYDKITILK